MNQRFVEAFYWVATLKSMTRAAEKLFMTQSAISSRVSALEEERAANLTDRLLTPALSSGEEERGTETQGLANR